MDGICDRIIGRENRVNAEYRKRYSFKELSAAHRCSLFHRFFKTFPSNVLNVAKKILTFNELCYYVVIYYVMTKIHSLKINVVFKC